ncbi:MAG: ABC transporter ATP-binding protein [Ilumatobacteraceae bacterium]
MSNSAIVVEHVSKNFRLYRERNRYIKSAVLRGRRARYEEFWALDDVSFEVEHGATVGLIGSNGSGKSTMLKCLTGIYRPDKGRIATDGSLAALLELGAGFHPELSGRENIFLNAAILGMSKKEAERQFDSIVEFAGLDRFIDTPVKNYSSGMTVRLGFSIASHVEPDILLIDEVLSVGDQAFQRKSTDRIEQFRREGKTIVVVSHSLASIQQLCKEVIWLEKGKVRQRGPAADVIANYTGESYDVHAQQDAEHRERWGTGAAHITSLRLLDGQGNVSERMATNAPAKVVVDITPAEKLHSPTVRLMITRVDGTVVWSGTSQNSRPPLGHLGEQASLEVSIERMPLLEGSYFLSAAITDATGTTEFDHLRNWVKFEVHQEQFFEEGVLSLPASWSLNKRG